MLGVFSGQGNTTLTVYLCILGVVSGQGKTTLTLYFKSFKDYYVKTNYNFAQFVYKIIIFFETTLTLVKLLYFRFHEIPFFLFILDTSISQWVAPSLGCSGVQQVRWWHFLSWVYGMATPIRCTLGRCVIG